jgi:excinuclease ABC subunit C
MTSELDSKSAKLSEPPQSIQLAWASVWSSLPLSPGVYWFLDANDNVLYVGKAKNLKARINSYKLWKQTHGKTRRLVFTATQLKHQVLDSELEALLVEAELIRTHQPPFNILLKDDKTPLYIHVTEEEYPRVLTVRKKDFEKKHLAGAVLGPFPSAYKVKEVLSIGRKIFPFCTGPRNAQFATRENTPCFHYHIDECSGVCIGEQTKEDYLESIKQLTAFLKGKKKDVVHQVEAQMKQAAETENYELAAELRDRMKAIKDVTERKVLLKPELQLPRLKESLRAEGLIQLRRFLAHYMNYPRTYPLTRLECYDVSNIQGTNASVAMVTFINGVSDTSQYRLFNIRTLNTPNDYAMMQEAVLRRQNHAEWGTPNLIIIDGGKGQLRAALKVWHWSIPVISIAKKPDRLIFPVMTDAGGQRSEDLKNLKYEEVKLAADHPALTLVQQLRDEAHRFSKKQHTRLRQRAMLE